MVGHCLRKAEAPGSTPGRSICCNQKINFSSSIAVLPPNFLIVKAICIKSFKFGEDQTENCSFSALIECKALRIPTR